MSLVHIIDLSISFLGKDLFQNLGLQVESGQKIGLIGPNGSGKTSLLRLITGEITPDKGEVRKIKGLRPGYLPQDLQESLSGTLLQTVLNSVPGRVRLRERIQKIEASLKQTQGEQEKAKLVEELAELHLKASDLDARFPSHRAERILSGLGFKQEEFHEPVSTLSGGWRMRSALGSLLYQSPDLLLLDEPTNHLDVPSVRWLEGFLKGYKGALILICHDRDFLNRQIDRVISFEPEGIRFYSGDYDFYLKAREEEQKTLEANARKQEQKVKEAKRFIERFRAKASKARQAQSKIKLVKKMELIETHKKKQAIRFSFPPVPRSGGDVVTIRGVSKGFDGKILYEALDLRVTRGERVAIIGPNGSGKTTLLRMVAGEMKPDRGGITAGHEVDMSYYAQHHSEMLDPQKSIIEEVYQVVPHESISFVRGVCGAFLFSGSDVDKSIGILSGGEKARVSLAKILVKPGNLLVMDEPTNHLDIVSSEILIDALQDFNGTLLFVSHNQSFANRLATKIWDIREGEIIEYPGTLYEYYEYLSRMEKAEEMAALDLMGTEEKEAQSLGQDDLQNKKERRRERAEKRKMISAALMPIRERLAELEQRIDDLEIKEKELGGLLADPEIFKDESRSVPLMNEYGEVKKRLEELLARWEYKHNELESAKKSFGIQEEL